MIRKTIYAVSVGTLLLAGTAIANENPGKKDAGKETTIEHKDGTKDTVRTGKDGHTTVTKESGGVKHETGDAASHKEVVKDHTEPGDKVTPKK